MIEVYKPYGMTPKEVAEKVKEHTGAQKTAFSGRLDPMACGILRIYLNDSCKLTPNEDKLDKVYRFKFAFGIKTTSGDMLGFPTYRKRLIGIKRDDIIDILESYRHYYLQRVPKYSSFVVRNKRGEKHPLWWWTQNSRLNEVSLPYIKRVLYNYHIDGFGETTLGEIATLAIDRISKISETQSFSQTSIMESWTTFKDVLIPVLTFEMLIEVSSGFYVRQLVEDIGAVLGVDTMTIEIERTQYKDEKKF